MKKVIFALLIVCLVGAAIGIGTWAIFTDIETSYDNMFTAGKLDLKVDLKDDPDVAIYFENIEPVKPGDGDEVFITLTNEGSIDGIADIMIIKTLDDDNGITEPEDMVDGVIDGKDGTTLGDLGRNLNLRITANLDDDPDYEYPINEGTVWNLDMVNVDFGFLPGVDEPPYSSVDIKIEWWVDINVGNIIQTDKLRFDIEFSLNQPMAAACIEVVEIQQPEVMQECEMLTLAVDVYNSGEMPGEGTVDVTIVVDGTPVGEVLGTATGMVDPKETVKVAIPGEWHVDETWVDEIITVTAVSTCGDPMECTIAVMPPFWCEVVWIQQPEVAYWCDDLVVGVDVHNSGAKTGECVITAIVVDEAGDPLCAPVEVGTGMLVPCEVTKVEVDLGHVENWWPPMVFVLAWCCDQPLEEPFICPMLVTEPVVPPPEPSSTWVHNLHYDDGVSVINDTVWTTHLVEGVASIPDMVPLCTEVTPPAGPAAHASVTLAGEPCIRVSAGESIEMFYLEAYADLTHGESLYAYINGDTGGLSLELENLYEDYALTGGANIGKPYAVGNSWTLHTHVIALVMGTACMSEAEADLTVTVSAEPSTISVPAGDFDDCFKIETVDPDKPGLLKTVWWSPTVQSVVKQVDTLSFDGTETWELASYTLVP